MVDQKPSLDSLRIDDSERRRPSGRRWPWLLVLLLIVVGAVAFWLWKQRASVPSVTVATARETTGGARVETTVLEASGYVTARRQATVSSKVTGKVVEVLVEEGMEVEKGQILARLDDSLARRQLALARAELASARSSLEETRVRLSEAEINLERTRRLVEAEIATDAQLDADQAAADSLAARLAAAEEEVSVSARRLELRRQELEDLVIRAPFAGVAVSKDAQPGEMISPVSAGGGFTRTGICTLVDMSSLEIEVDVSESYINRVSAGQPVVATLDAYPDWQIPARVIISIPAADRQKATVKVRIAFDELDPRILPDMGVKVQVKEAAEREGAADETRRQIFVPLDALRQRVEDEAVVFLLDGERVERRRVRLGGEERDEVEILTGVAGGDRVVVEGPSELADGDRVRLDEDD